jgi:hypothetical protein
MKRLDCSMSTRCCSMSTGCCSFHFGNTYDELRSLSWMLGNVVFRLTLGEFGQDNKVNGRIIYRSVGRWR